MPGVIGMVNGAVATTDERGLPHAIRVEVTIRDGVFHADFTGTHGAAPGNVNCPIAVTRCK